MTHKNGRIYITLLLSFLLNNFLFAQDEKTAPTPSAEKQSEEKRPPATPDVVTPESAKTEAAVTPAVPAAGPAVVPAVEPAQPAQEDQKSDTEKAAPVEPGNVTVNFKGADI